MDGLARLTGAIIPPVLYEKRVNRCCRTVRKAVPPGVQNLSELPFAVCNAGMVDQLAINADTEKKEPGLACLVGITSMVSSLMFEIL